MTVARVNWNTEMGCLKVQLLKQHYQWDRCQKKILAALKVKHTGWAAQHAER